MNSPFDMPSPLTRRAALSAVVGLGAAAVLAACGSDSKNAATTSTGAASTAGSTTDAATTTPTTTEASTTAASTTASTSAGTSESAATPATTATVTCDPIPEETAGPFPGDGSNGPDVLSIDGVVRPDIRTSIGSASGTAEGLPLVVNLSVIDTSSGCAALAGAAVYIWHCDRDGNYSMYSGGAANENYLRGVQAADGAGSLSFTTIFPGAYSGRWPHIHFEVYESVEAATSGGRPIAISQLALPAATCVQAYATVGYEQSVRNLAQTSLEDDNVFGEDDGVRQLATMTGDAASGFTAALTVPV